MAQKAKAPRPPERKFADPVLNYCNVGMKHLFSGLLHLLRRVSQPNVKSYA